MPTNIVRGMSSAILLSLLIGCAIDDPDNSLSCAAKPDYRIQTYGVGPEDVVAIALDQHRTRLFVREVCRGSTTCDEQSHQDRFRIGTIDIGPSAKGGETEIAWRPKISEEFEPLGMSFVPGDQPGQGDLFLIDAVNPIKIWRLPVRDGTIEADDSIDPWFIDDDGQLTSANDLQAVGDSVYVTRFDSGGFWPGELKGWHGVIQLRQGIAPILREGGFRGANGIIDLSKGDRLIVADYWSRRLRYVSKDPNGDQKVEYATGVLPIYPDNLTLDGNRILIAGQRHSILAGLNIFLPFIPSPSAVLEIPVDKLGKQEPNILWWSGLFDGRSVSVAVSVPGGLALGQIRAADVLHVSCPG